MAQLMHGLAKVLPTLMELAGVALIATAAALVFPPLALALGGAWLILTGYTLASERKRTSE